MNKPRVIIVDVRNGMVKANAANIDLPLEGQVSALRSIETADVLVEIHPDTILVREGADKGWVTMLTTKPERQMNAEKAARELQSRVGDKPIDDLDVGEHPVEEKFRRVWEGDSNSGTAELKGF